MGTWYVITNANNIILAVFSPDKEKEAKSKLSQLRDRYPYASIVMTKAPFKSEPLVGTKL